MTGAAEHPLRGLAPLAAHRQWVVVVLKPKPSGGTDKLPFQPSCNAASVSDPATWVDYETVARTAAVWGGGVGFVLTEADAFVVIDLDDALQPDGTWSRVALDICAALPGAVVEVSQSGRGLHVWARRAAVPPHACKATVDGQRLECYSSGRFIMLGSNASGTLAEDCPAIDDVIARYFPPRVAAAPGALADDGPRVDWRGPADDDELLRRAMQSKSQAGVFGNAVTFAELWNADADALGRRWPAPGRPYDASSADAALAAHLAFFTGCDAPRIERLMRRSALVREKWDRADYLPRTAANACGQQREVYRGGQTAAEWQPMSPEAIQASRDFGISDPLSATKLFVRARYEHSEGALLRSWQGSFYRWRDAHWRELAEVDVKADIYDFLDRQPGSDYRPDQTRVNKVLDALRHALSVHLDSTLMPPCWISGAPLAPAAEIVACANGLLHLPSRSLISATPRFFNLNAVPFNYDARAAAPVQWLQFLATIWPNDPEAIATLQQMFGYLLTPDTSQQKIFLVIGPKRSGKGTIARVLTEMLGPDNVAGPTLASMASTFGLQPLIGTLAAIISDARLSGRTDQKEVAENLLRISGEDRIEIGRKFLPSLTMRLGTRFVLLTNELPRIADASGAMASRFVILTMNESFLGREDPGLTTRLLTELPGVLAWAVDGWHRLKARGYFVEPKSSAGAAQELADLGSPIGAFVRDECERASAAEMVVEDLFRAWTTWCARQGIGHCGSLQTFGRDLRAAFPAIEQARPRVGGDRVRVYRGIRLRSGPQWSAVHPIAAPTRP